MESSQRDLIDMIVDRFIFNNNEITTLTPCFAFIPKTGAGLPKTGVNFHWVYQLVFTSNA